MQVLETLRDAWQGLPAPVPTDKKVAFARRLVAAGFPRIDIGSFVSRKRVPAMADTGDVLRAIPDASFTALVASEGGMERLLEHPNVSEVLFPFSLSETFQQRNTGVGREEAFRLLSGITARAHAANRTMYVTISMAFGNNEGDPFDVGELRDWLARLKRAGVDRTGLADTTAQATPEVVREVYRAVMDGADWPTPSAHMHVTAGNQEAMVDAALESGVRTFDAALGGLGGCQFAKGAESNVSTLPLARQVEARGLEVELPLEQLEELDAAARELAELP